MVLIRRDGVLEARGLTYGYGRRRVLGQVDMELRPGEMVGLIGPNGSGKSTLLGLLSGLLVPWAGRVVLDDLEVHRMSRLAVAQRIGLGVQQPQLAPGFTAMETVLSGRFAAMGRRMFEGAEDVGAAREALAMVGLEGLSGRTAATMSGGERQRLALARVLGAVPSILLLDEPTSALDPDYQVKVMVLLEGLCRRERLAVCVVSHDLNLAGMFCDRLVLLKGGRCLAQGSPGEVLTQDLLRSAYGVSTVVDREPTRGRPRVTLVPVGCFGPDRGGAR
jgi:iron complex transport system ATP-binding protein